MLSTKSFSARLASTKIPRDRASLIWYRGLWDELYFARHFFPDETSDEDGRPIAFSAMHRHEMRPGQARHRGVKWVIPAPTASAKSTLLVNIRLAHRIVYRLERFICIGSGRAGQGGDRVIAVREMLRSRRIERFFGPQVPEIAGKTDFRSLSGCRVMSFGRQTAIRGLLDITARPSLFVLDDIDGDTANDDVREMDRTWFFRVLQKRGTDMTNWWLVGTIVHQDGIVATALASDAWSGRIWRAVIEWPDRADLWQACRRIYARRELGDRPERIAAARAYYMTHRAEMDAGAEVLWPANRSEDLFGLHIQLWEDGRAAFWAEKQNDPRAAEGKLIDSSICAHFQIVNGQLEIRPDQGSPVERYIDLSDLIMIGFFDPCGQKRRSSMRHGSYGAIATIGVDGHSNAYLVSCWVRRTGPDGQLTALIAEWTRWRWAYIGVETNLYRGMLVDALARRLAQRKVHGESWQMPIQEIRVSEPKTRILAIEPWLSNGWLALNDALPQEAVRQIETGVAEPNDAPDAVTAALELARRMGVIS